MLDDGINQELCKCGKPFELSTHIEKLQDCAIILIVEEWVEIPAPLLPPSHKKKKRKRILQTAGRAS